MVEVCQRLDGVPLAIELAAARLIALSPADLLMRLNRRFKVLAGGRRGAVGRHATLRAAIDWSYELLDPAEQALLARLSVFSGGCTLEAVEQVCSGGAVDREDVIDLVTSLVSRSLVTADESGASTRFRLLETIREYGEERLAERGETEELLKAHARYFVDLCGRAAENFYGPAQLVWARRLNLERDNLRAALANAIDLGDTQLAVALVVDYPHRHHQGATPMGDALVVPAAQVVNLAGAADEEGYPRALTVAAFEAGTNGDYRKSEEFCSLAVRSVESRPVAQRDPRVEIDANAARSQIYLAEGAYGEAAVAYWRAAHVAESQDFIGLSAVFHAYGATSALIGNIGHPDTAAHARSAVTLARASGMPGAIVVSLNALALTLADEDPIQARALLQESIERTQTADGEITQSFITACIVAARLADWGLTLQLVARSMYVWRWNMNVELQAAPFLTLCARALAEERPEQAGVLLGATQSAFGGKSKALRSDITTRQSTERERALWSTISREANELVAASLGERRARDLRVAGAAMNVDEAVSYTLSIIDA